MFGIYGEVSKSHGDIWLQLEIIARIHIFGGLEDTCRRQEQIWKPMVFPRSTGRETDGCPLYSHPANLKDNKNCVLCFTCLRACPHRNVPLGSIFLLFNGLVVFFWNVTKLFWTCSIGKNLDDWRGITLPHPQRVIHQLPKWPEVRLVNPPKQSLSEAVESPSTGCWLWLSFSLSNSRHGKVIAGNPDTGANSSK